MSIHIRYSLVLGIIFAWTLVGFPLVASTANALELATSEIMIGVRAVVALLCAIMIAFSLVHRRWRTSVTQRLMIMFFALYTVRIANDTLFSEVLLRQPDYYYWAFAIGVSFLPALTLSLLARHLDFGRGFIPIMMMGMAVLAFATTFGGTVVQNATGATYDTGRLALESINPISLGHVGVTVVVLTYWRLRMLPFTLAALALWLPATFLGLYVLLASGSRGPLVAMICAILFFEAVKGGRLLIILSIFSAPILAVLTIDVSRLETALGTNIFSRLETAISGGDASSLARVDQIGSAWRLFLDNPLSGAALEDPAYGIYPHNVIVEAFMALGVFGGTLLVALVAITGIHAFRLSRNDPVWSVYGALFVQYIVAAQLSGGLYGSSAMWALIGYIAGTQIPQVVGKAHPWPGIHTFGHRLPLEGLPVGVRSQVPLQRQVNVFRTGPAE